MPRSADFDKIYRAFMWRYCDGQAECDTGKNYYYGWLKSNNLDDTKPYGPQSQAKEKFSFAEPYIQYLREDEQAKYFKVEALFPLSSMNNNLYSQEELLRAARSLIGKPVNWNHFDGPAEGVSIFDAEYEDDCVESILRVAKGSEALQKIESGNVSQVSIECDCLRGSELTPNGWTCNGQVFTGLALLTKGVLPGVPLTRIMPVEKLVESFTVIDVGEKGKEPKTEDFGDASFPDSCFAWIPDSAKGPDGRKSDRKLPYKNKDGTVDLDHVRNALGRLDQTDDIPEDEKNRIRTMLQNILAKANPDYKPESAGDTGAKEIEQQEATEMVVMLDQKIRTLEAERALIEAVVRQADGLEAKLARLDQLLNQEEAREAREKAKKTEPCRCVLTKEGFWARFHQLRAEGLDKANAFRIVSQEVIEAATKKSQ